ncbi:MAG: 50S ribosome-binding GTPase, partial [Candidatus Omnitrophica bacterium]|nr:50S ribosome-binding GTPase [Candidatus Omnitrophota bacterium]
MIKTIYLIGNPNVGKSVIFSRLTGVRVIASNYPGTTVEFLKGYLKINNEKIEVWDLPGTIHTVWSGGDTTNFGTAVPLSQEKPWR